MRRSSNSSSMYRKVSQLEDDEDAFDVNDYRDVISSSSSSQQLPPGPIVRQQSQPLLLTSTGSLDYDFYEDMDERDSIYLDAVSINSDGPNARKSLYLSRQTVYHSAEELPLDGAVPDGSGTLRSIKTTTESLLNDSRANGGLPNLPYEPRPGGSSSFGGGILKRPGLTTKYNEELRFIFTSSELPWEPAGLLGSIGWKRKRAPVGRVRSCALSPPSNWKLEKHVKDIEAMGKVRCGEELW